MIGAGLSLFAAVPGRVKLCALLVLIGVLALAGIRRKIASDAIEKLARKIEHEDNKRASAIRCAAANAGRVHDPDDQRGYRD